ncbi:MAG: GNAT family N-acetyltransferase [Stenotrophobium sp.]
MNSSLRIRAATVQDVPLIFTLIRELADYEKLTHEVLATEGALRRTLFGAHPAAEVLMGELGGEPAGFALFFPSYSTFLARPGIYLEDLYVRLPLRGRGVGRALLARVAALVEERGCGRLEWSVLDWNEPALKFYASLGAKPMSEWTMYRVTGDALRALAALKT